VQRDGHGDQQNGDDIGQEHRHVRGQPLPHAEAAAARPQRVERDRGDRRLGAEQGEVEGEFAAALAPEQDQASTAARHPGDNGQHRIDREQRQHHGDFAETDGMSPSPHPYVDGEPLGEREHHHQGAQPQQAGPAAELDAVAGPGADGGHGRGAQPETEPAHPRLGAQAQAANGPSDTAATGGLFVHSG
jgi:hypothetical protein